MAGHNWEPSDADRTVDSTIVAGLVAGKAHADRKVELVRE